MKKTFYSVLSMVLLSSLSCREAPKAKVVSTVAEAAVADTSPSEVPSEPEVLSEKEQPRDTTPRLSIPPSGRIVHTDTVRRDTLVGDYHVSWVVQNNDDFILNLPVREDSIFFPGREIVLDVAYKRTPILHKVFEREFFSEYLPENQMDEFVMQGMRFMGIEKDTLILKTNVCVPDTDDCYDFTLFITNQGEFRFEKIVYPDEGSE